MATKYGTNGPDLLNGTALADSLFGLGGNDTLNGLNGNDLVQGGAGNDRLDGGIGIDTADYSDAKGGVTVDLAAGIATGERGRDTLIGIESVRGGDYADTLTVGAGLPGYLYGMGGNDRLVGTTNGTTLVGGKGDDVLLGDIFSYEDATGGVTVNLTTRTATGAMGRDTLIYANQHYNYHDAIGGRFADTLIGDWRPNYLQGGAGDDHLYGRSGDDVLQGGLGNDTLDGGDGTDRAFYLDITDRIVADLASGTASGTQIGTDRLVGIESLDSGSGADSLRGSAAADSISGGLGKDYVAGGGGDDSITGDNAAFGSFVQGNDDLWGGAGNDRIAGDGQNTGSGRCGNDTIHGDQGADLLYGDNGADLGASVVCGDDRIYANAGGVAENGSPLGDELYGDAHWLEWSARGGNDLLYGGDGLGQDTLIGDAADSATGVVVCGDDQLYGGAGGDVLIGDATRLGESSQDHVTAGDDQLYGGAGNDVLIGDARYHAMTSVVGDDRLDGGVGNDELHGDYGSDGFGNGRDQFFFAPGSGHDTIADFHQGEDRIDLSAYGYTGFNQLDIASDGTSSTITLAGTGNVIEVEGVAHLATADFMLG